MLLGVFRLVAVAVPLAITPYEMFAAKKIIRCGRTGPSIQLGDINHRKTPAFRTFFVDSKLMFAIGAGVARRLFLFSHSHLKGFHADLSGNLAGFLPVQLIQLTE
jgi:hypothetical protein